MIAAAVVTGGSGGIGASVARRLAREGHLVTISYRQDKAAATAVAEEIIAGGGRCLPVRADVTEPTDVAALFAAAEAAHGPTGILVNSAGALFDALLIEMTDQQWHDALAVNLTGPLLCCRQVAHGMMRARWGRIVNISSVTALIGPAGQGNYAAAKAGLLGLTRSLARELAGRGITCNAVLPGFVETKIISHLSDKRYTELRRQVPLGRFGTAEEIAAAVCFLCGADGTYITGAAIPVDGGTSIGM
ncbi:SDR family oxidoreductase [Actinomadura sp. KC216]|uniref:3-oxoacyl-ACP reductase FabG n=1 Tax=Actinomadura sp. KC216 TaxID=2530370 RepID=UPI00104986FF|nr:3-oxoacyl-ACP reductase FabG [Actinomadura sp. KC216]TDB91179.1 SDR family oxidoreductase [Actinomadura sp. KC216]